LPTYDKEAIAKMIDHTQLKPHATQGMIIQCCMEAIENSFASVCISPVHVALAAKHLSGTPVKLCSVIGFPLGANSPETKAFEADAAVKNGATEIDMVINIGALKEGLYRFVEDEIRQVVKASDGALVKVIIETCYLSDEEKIAACNIAKTSGAHFVKTSTGFGPSGATVADVELMRKTVGGNFGVKASGGIRTLSDAISMIKAGANRLGLSSSLSIINELNSE
jgi:deoxyribose-phosphate aldolase